MKILKNSGAFLLLFLTTIVIFSTTLFFFDVSITRYHLIISFIISSILYYFASERTLFKKEYFKTILLSLLVIVISTGIATFTFDRSSDGNTYHKDAIGLLKEGFNPAKETSYSFIEKRDNSTELTDYTIWTDHYAKANWIMAANFYKTTNHI